MNDAQSLADMLLGLMLGVPIGAAIMGTTRRWVERVAPRTITVLIDGQEWLTRRMLPGDEVTVRCTKDD